MRRQEFFTYCFFFLFSLAMLFAVIPAFTGPKEDWGISGYFLPNGLCGVIALLSGMQIIRGLKMGFAACPSPEMDLAALFHLAKYIGTMALIIPLWKLLGFIPGSVIILTALLLLAGERSFKRIIPIAVLVPLVVYCLIWFVLRIPTP